jgi:hypothetical protein
MEEIAVIIWLTLPIVGHAPWRCATQLRRAHLLSTVQCNFRIKFFSTAFGFELANLEFASRFSKGSSHVYMQVPYKKTTQPIQHLEVCPLGDVEHRVLSSQFWIHPSAVTVTPAVTCHCQLGTYDTAQLAAAAL